MLARRSRGARAITRWVSELVWINDLLPKFNYYLSFLIISNFIYNICTYFFGILILRENRDLKKIRSDPKNEFEWEPGKLPRMENNNSGRKSSFLLFFVKLQLLWKKNNRFDKNASWLRLLCRIHLFLGNCINLTKTHFEWDFRVKFRP